MSYTYLALGDSYTIGEGVNESDRWSAQLVEKLKLEKINIAPPEIIAQTGWTTSELAEGIKRSGNEKKYSFVSLLIGVNNQYRGEDKIKFRDEFASLLATAVLFTNGVRNHVFVLSIPDWSVTPYAASFDREKIALEIDSFNAIVLQECDKAGIIFIDITSLSRAIGGDLALLAPDGLHYSGKMYEKWAAKILPIVLKVIN